MWFLYVLAFVLLLIILFTIIPIKLHIILDEGFVIKLKIFSFAVFQSDKKSDSKKKNEKKKTKTEQKKKKSSPDEILKSIRLYFELLKDALKFLRGYFKKKKIIDNFSFGINYGFEDAALTGIFTGGLYAIFYPFNTFLTESYSITNHEITIEPDFNQKIFKIKSTLIIKIKIYSFLYFAVKEGIKYLKYQKEKEGKKNVRSSD